MYVYSMSNTHTDMPYKPIGDGQVEMKRAAVRRPTEHNKTKRDIDRSTFEMRAIIGLVTTPPHAQISPNHAWCIVPMAVPKHRWPRRHLR